MSPPNSDIAQVKPTILNKPTANLDSIREDASTLTLYHLHLHQQQGPVPAVTNLSLPMAGSQQPEKPQLVIMDDASPPSGKPELSLVREIALITVVCMSQFLALAGLAQSIAPIRIIGESFGTDEVGKLSWFPAA